MQFRSPKCKCWNLSQLSRQGYILGRFLLGFSQCNSRVPDWIPARCFEASLSQQNGFSSLIEPSSCLIWFLWKLLTYSAIISYKKAKVGPELGLKSDLELEPKSGPELEPKLGPELGPKRGPELKDPFCPDFRSLFWNQFRVQFWDQIWAGSNGTSCFNSTLKITGNKGYCKGDDKADKTQLEDNARTAPTIFSIATKLSKLSVRNFSSNTPAVSPLFLQIWTVSKDISQAKKLLELISQRQSSKQTSRSLGRYNGSTF